MPRIVFSILLLLTFAAHTLGKGKDLYELLQVPKGANDAQIKRSYRKLALKYHPDKVSGSEADKKDAEKKFAEINHAYEVLSDSEKRSIYDRHGEEGLRQFAGQQSQEAQSGGSIFDFFFGQQGMHNDEDRVQKGHTVTIDLHVTLADLYVGKEMKVTRDKAVVKPASGTRECKCKQKLVTKQLGPGMFQQYHKQVCEQCPNVKLEREQEVLTVHVEPGMANGQAITFFEEGEPMIDGEPGDLKFVIRTVPSQRWERRGDDLLINETITLVDALTGFTRIIKHLDGQEVTLKADRITKPGDYQHYPGQGMPVHNAEPKKGDLWVLYTVAFPTHLSSEQQQQVRDLLGHTHMPIPPTAAA
ncbi:ER DnaJ-like protein 1 [Haematococcus lacustris]